MKKIALYCVNYHSYASLTAYLCSIDQAASKAANDVHIDVYVADNTEQNTQDIDYQPQHISIRLFPYHQNLGYFGAIKKMMAESIVSNYDFVIISNVDLTLPEDCFQKLSTTTLNDDIAWIAPSIYSEKRHYDRNPQAVNRYPLTKLRILRFAFKYPFIHYVYTKTLLKRKRLQKEHQPGIIYSGHGAFIILTHTFFEKCPTIDYPLFLYGEELYLAETCRKLQLKVIYRPDIKILDQESVSTSKMRRRLYYRYNYEGLDYLIKTFY